MEMEGIFHPLWCQSGISSSPFNCLALLKKYRIELKGSHVFVNSLCLQPAPRRLPGHNFQKYWRKISQPRTVRLVNLCAFKLWPVIWNTSNSCKFEITNHCHEIGSLLIIELLASRKRLEKFPHFDYALLVSIYFWLGYKIPLMHKTVWLRKCKSYLL